MTQWNAVDRERSERGPGCVKLVAVLISAEREHSSLFDAQDGSTYIYTETHTITRVLEKIAKRERPNIPRAPSVPSQGGQHGRSLDMTS